MQLKRTKQLIGKLPEDFQTVLIFLILFGEYFYGIMVHIYLGLDTFKRPTEPDLNIWISLYKKKNLSLLSHFLPQIVYDELSPELQKNHFIKWALKKSPEFSFYRLGKLLPRLAKIKHHLLKMKDQFETQKGFLIDNVVGQLKQTLSQKEVPVKPVTLDELSNVHLRFYIMNWIPCWLFLGEHFPRLLRKARTEYKTGNIASLEKLLRLDKRAIYEPGIAKIWRELSFQPQNKKFKRLIKALEQTPQIPDKKQFKILLAALISLLAERENIKLRPQQIHKIFESVSRDITGTIDYDIPDNPDALYKGISRHKKFWELLFSKTS
ncbi:MAG TPA: hypothetical protein PKB02_08375 [Anaerohalosphaeraceae bacterium]|nr:hypothetical protein [Anaerohalosphaeraceae bacterium]